jgi:hypothetical protein
MLFMHSTTDEVTSIQGARDLFAVANEVKRWVQVEGVAHLRMLFDWPDYVPTVVGWFDSHLSAPPG